MSAITKNSSLDQYIFSATQAAERGDFQGAVKAIYQNQNQQPQGMVTVVSGLVANILAKSRNHKDPKRIEICAKIEAELLKLKREELGIPNLPDEKLRQMAIEFAQAKHSGSAFRLAEQIQDVNIQQEAVDAITDAIDNMSPRSAIIQTYALAASSDGCNCLEDGKISSSCNIEAKFLASQRKEQGIPNLPDATFRQLAIQSAQAKHCGSAVQLAEQIQDDAIRQEAIDGITDAIEKMSPRSAYNQANAFLFKDDNWEKAKKEFIENLQNTNI